MTLGLLLIFSQLKFSHMKKRDLSDDEADDSITLYEAWDSYIRSFKKNLCDIINS